jgi:hypothetical protein
VSLESSLWNWLANGWKQVPEDVLHYTRIENSASAGAPDVDLHYHNQAWLELKVAERMAGGKRLIVPHLRGKQVEWLHNRWLVGGRAWLLLRMEKRKSRVHYLVPGSHAMALYRRQLTEEEVAYLSWCEPGATPMDILLAAAVADRE